MKLSQIDQVQLPSDVDFSQIISHSEFIGNQPSQPQAPVNIFINSQMEMQEIHGIGGSFSEIGGKTLMSLEEKQRDELSKALFSSHLNYFRLPVGSSDFGLSAYSLNDQEGDFAMKHFSLKRDEEWVIPYLNQAKKHCPSMKIHISPWSPPSWLKVDGQFGGGSPLVDKEEYYKAYALYFAKYIQEYSKLGFCLDRLNVQNEPDVNPAYPSCNMPPRQMAHFIKNFLYPTFLDMGIDTEIFAGTFRSINGASASDFLTATPDIHKYIGGIGTQYSSMQPIYDILSKVEYQHLKYMHTESNCFDGQNSWEQAITLYKSIVSYITAGCDSFTYWNMILDTSGKSTWGWAQNSMVSVDLENKTVVYNPDFHIMKLATAVLPPHSKRVSYISRNQLGIASKHYDGTIQFMCSNFKEEEKSGKVVVDEKEYEITLAPMSLTGFTLC